MLLGYRARFRRWTVSGIGIAELVERLGREDGSVLLVEPLSSLLSDIATMTVQDLLELKDLSVVRWEPFNSRISSDIGLQVFQPLFGLLGQPFTQVL
jgi:hypothetical protein